jgi:hypothetical protein
MTAEFPDMSLTELEARRALVEEEPEEFAGMSLTDLEAEYGQPRRSARTMPRSVPACTGPGC